MAAIPYLFITLATASCGLGVYVLHDHADRPANRAFFVFASGIGLWIGSFGALLLTEAQGWLLSLNAGGLCLVAGLTWFAHSFPKPQKYAVRGWVFWLPLLAGGSFLIASGTVVSRVEVLPNGMTEVTHGPLISVWTLLLWVYALISIFRFVEAFRDADREDRMRLWYVYFGLVIFAGSALTFDALLPGLFGIVRLNYLGPLSVFVLLAAVTYGILKDSFLDIRFIIQRSAIYTLSFFVLAVLYVAVLLCTEQLEHLAGMAAPVSAGITLLIGMYTLPRLEAYFRKITDPFFFRGHYDHFTVQEQLSLALNTHLDLYRLVDTTLAIVDTALRPEYSRFQHEENAISYIERGKHSRPTAEVLSNDSITVPILSGQRVIGAFEFGPKRSGDRYTREDRILLRTFGANAALAFEKAELYRELQAYSAQLEEKVEERTRHLAEMQVSQRQLFDDLSHALQTPLTVLKSGIELIGRASSVPTGSLLSMLEASVDSLSGLVRSMLKLARIGALHDGNQAMTVDLSALISRIAEYAQIVGQAEDIEVISSVSPGIQVQGVEHQLEEAVANILSNALKYTAGCPDRTVHLELHRNTAAARIVIRDSGKGMSPADAAEAFERFYRSGQAEKGSHGTGLGLPICKRIVERHGGTISLTSALGRGTQVNMEIPLM